MAVCSKCGKKSRGAFCSGCGASLKGEVVKPSAGAGIKLPQLSAQQVKQVGMAVAVLLVLGVAGTGVYLLLTGYFQAPVLLKSQVRSSVSKCSGTFTYSVDLGGAQGPVSGQGVTAYADNASLERLNTDQNGKLSSTLDMPAEWCGKTVNISFLYAGDWFHSNATNSTLMVVRAPTTLRLLVQNETKTGEQVVVSLELLNTVDKSVVSGKQVVVSDDMATNVVTVMGQPTLLNYSWETVGTKTINAYFSGDSFYEASTAQEARVFVLPQTCNDGTVVKTCSSASIGYYCTESKSLVFDCNACGCKTGLICFQNACVSGEEKTNQIISALQQSVVQVNNLWASGSGVILSNTGGQTVVLTNRHVVDPFQDYGGATSQKVTFNDGTVAQAREIRYAPNGMDFAVIYLQGQYGSAAKIDYMQAYTNGREVVAIGSPMGTLFQSVSKGIISGVRTETTSKSYAYSVIQTDAAINPGNSGGGLFLTETQSLAGINTFSQRISAQGLPLEGLNFAVDIKELQNLGDYSAWTVLQTKSRCSDGTLYGQCSSETVGLYCSGGRLVNSCGSCGCSSAYPYCKSSTGQCVACATGSVWSSIYEVCCPYGWTANIDGCCPPGTHYVGGGKCAY